MKLTYYGHACFSVEIRGKHFLFDPYITPNPLAKNIDVKAVPADFILISHGHDDHIADAVKMAKHTKAKTIANFEVATWLEKKGVPDVRAMNPGGCIDLDFVQINSVNAIHSSSLPGGKYGGAPGGFVLTSAEGNFYYSGDTALTRDMELISETTKLNFAVLCIGGNFTMGADDAIRAAKLLDCNSIVGVHYDTFPQIKIDHTKTLEKFSSAGMSLRLLGIGETVNL